MRQVLPDVLGDPRSRQRGVEVGGVQLVLLATVGLTGTSNVSSALAAAFKLLSGAAPAIQVLGCTPQLHPCCLRTSATASASSYRNCGTF